MNAIVPVTVHADELETIQCTARLLAVSGYFDAKGDTPMAIAQLATKILAGREFGFGPFAAVNGIYIVQGRPSIGANLMASAVKASPRYDYRVRENSDKTCRIEFFERVAGKLESLGVSEFTADDARKAGTKNMDKYPRNMLFARAMSNGVRFYVPDVFNGNAVYVPEELGADVDGDGNIIDAEPPKRAVDASTGEILQPAVPAPRTAPPVQPEEDSGMGASNANPFEDTKPEPPTNEEHALIDTWNTFGDAYEWAVSIGGCENTFEAKNSMNKIVDAHGGVSKATLPAIKLAYVRRQREKLAETQAA